MVIKLNSFRESNQIDIANKIILIAIIVLLGFCFILSDVALGQSNLDYQQRTNRYEGIKQRPINAKLGIELISARIDHQDAIGSGEQYQVRFFLQQPHDVHLLVREIENEHYYWMDRVKPSAPWQTGFNNVFAWPTTDVIRQLGLSLNNLGVVVRLGNASPGAEERVAPALLFQSHQPTQVGGYVFIFRLEREAKLKAVVYPAAGSQPVFTQDLGDQPGGQPVEVRWNTTQVPQGAYRIVLNGYARDNNDPLTQIVHFYHQPVIR